MEKELTDLLEVQWVLEALTHPRHSGYLDFLANLVVLGVLTLPSHPVKNMQLKINVIDSVKNS